VKPYYEDDFVKLYHGDARDLSAWEVNESTVVTDPPYPNNAGHFDDAVDAARSVLCVVEGESVVFWNELSRPPVPLPLVAVHVWHRANVNGRPYEPVYHFCPSGIKRRSEIFRHAVEFENATGAEYLGHPTQKPVALMRRLIEKTKGHQILDPFCGVGSTLRAAKDLRRPAVGYEIEERYCEAAALRLAQDVLDLGEAA
jgi:hypothetical protein